MKKRTRCIIAVLITSAILLGMTGANALDNTMFTAEEKEYISQVSQGVRFGPTRSKTVEKKSECENTMFTAEEQKYFADKKAGVDFSPVITSKPEPAPFITNTMFSEEELDYLSNRDLPSD